MKPRTTLIVAAIFFGGLGFAAYYYKTAKNAEARAAKNELAARARRPIPVLLASAVSRDVPVWLDSPGTVQAYNSVTVRPRVSGMLDSVNFTEGQTVARGEILAQIDPRPYKAVLDQATARKEQDEAQLKNARIDLERIRALVEGDAESQRALDEQKTRVAQLEALLKAGQAAVDAAQLDLDFTTLRSPIDGRTGARLLDAGNIVTANQNTGIVVVTQMQPISVVFALAQKYLPLLRPGSPSGKLPLSAQALAYETKEVLGNGVVSLLDNQVDISTDNIRIKATFSNDDGTLWPGQYVSTRVHVDTIKNAVLIPAAAVVPGLQGHLAYVAKADNTVEARPVTTGITLDEEGLVVVVKGLKPGERVVREGQNKLKPGIRIAPVQETAPEKPSPALAPKPAPAPSPAPSPKPAPSPAPAPAKKSI
ncbi:MAG: efflux RND transporter periplasmic adaptor subunit [Puniceicoccales bacterium]|jgi:multidrug efflux system membrane fusion protein|nr:efflux RND transporter periplasmic adaptor subunit [Puniceicoccales bacterium]